MGRGRAADKLNEAQKVRIIRYYKMGNTLQQLATHFSVGADKIREILVNAGVQIRDKNAYTGNAANQEDSTG